MLKIEFFFSFFLFLLTSYQFEDAVREDLNEFVSKNVDKYLALVQDRIDIETGRGDSGILLKALDKLNIRLVAMKCTYCEIDMAK